MNCRRYREDFLVHQTGEDAPRERARWLAHQNRCPKCRQWGEAMAQWLTQFPRLGEGGFSPEELAELRARVWAAVRKDPLPASRPARTISWPRLVWAGGMALAASLTWLLIYPTPPPAAASTSEAAALEALADAVESEWELYAEVWGEIEALEALFPPPASEPAHSKRGEGSAASPRWSSGKEWWG